MQPEPFPQTQEFETIYCLCTAPLRRAASCLPPKSIIPTLMKCCLLVSVSLCAVAYFLSQKVQKKGSFSKEKFTNFAQSTAGGDGPWFSLVSLLLPLRLVLKPFWVHQNSTAKQWNSIVYPSASLKARSSIMLAQHISRLFHFLWIDASAWKQTSVSIHAVNMNS